MRIGDRDTERKLEKDTSVAKIIFEEVNKFIYLGTRITSKCEEDKEIDERQIKANRSVKTINHLIRSKMLPRNTKIKIYQTTEALYSYETWEEK